MIDRFPRGNERPHAWNSIEIDEVLKVYSSAPYSQYDYGYAYSTSNSYLVRSSSNHMYPVHSTGFGRFRPMHWLPSKSEKATSRKNI